MVNGWHVRGNEERRHHASREPLNSERIELGGHALHIFQDAMDEGSWLVWLNTEASDFDGLVLGVGATRDEAVAAAVNAVEMIEAALQGPPARPVA